MKIDSPVGVVAGMSTAPLEPLEETYFALNRMRGLVDAGKLSLMVTSTGTAWGNGVEGEAVTGGQISQLLEDQWAQVYYSSRYACAYLPRQSGSGDSTIWYLNGQSIQERELLARLFGGGHLCLSDLNNALPEVLAAMP